jgi:hypothetical protein
VDHTVRYKRNEDRKRGTFTLSFTFYFSVSKPQTTAVGGFSSRQHYQGRWCAFCGDSSRSCYLSQLRAFLSLATTVGACLCRCVVVSTEACKWTKLFAPVTELDKNARLCKLPDSNFTDSTNILVLRIDAMVRPGLVSSKGTGERFRTHYTALVAALVWVLANVGRIVDDSIKAGEFSTICCFQIATKCIIRVKGEMHVNGTNHSHNESKGRTMVTATSLAAVASHNGLHQ